MLPPSALMKGLASRTLPTKNSDSANIDVPQRMDPYGGSYVQTRHRKQHVFVDEGTYFNCNNAQSGVAIDTTSGFTATKPFLLIENLDSPGGKIIKLDYAALVTTVAGSAASALTLIQMAIVIDSILRYSSGTDLTTKIVNPNMSSTNGSKARITAGATAVAASAQARTIVGLRTLRPTVSATVADVVGETKLLNFGGVEGVSAGSITVANANIIPVALPAIQVAPQQSALIYVFYAASGTPVAAQYAPELGWVEE